MGANIKKNLRNGFEMPLGNSPFRMGTGAMGTLANLDNAGLWWKVKKGLPRAFNQAGTVFGGLGLVQAGRQIAAKIGQEGLKKAVPYITRKVLRSGAEEGAAQTSNVITNIINPFTP